MGQVSRCTDTTSYFANPHDDIGCGRAIFHDSLQIIPYLINNDKYKWIALCLGDPLKIGFFKNTWSINQLSVKGRRTDKVGRPNSQAFQNKVDLLCSSYVVPLFCWTIFIPHALCYSFLLFLNSTLFTLWSVICSHRSIDTYDFYVCA